MTNVGDLQVRVLPDMKGFAPAVAAGSQAAGAAGGKGFLAGFNAKKVGLGMTAGITLPLALAGKAILDTGQKFESAMSRIAGITGEPAAAIDAVAQKAKDLGVATQFSAVESADALEVLARAGMDTADMIGSIDGVLSMAAADNMELADAASIASAAINAFSLEASDASMVADAMAGASAAADTNITDLGEAFKYTALASAEAGQSIPETTAALASMADNAIKGSMAGTSLRGMMSKLNQPTAEAQQWMDKLGLSFYDAEGNMVSYTDMAGQLEKGFKGLTREERTNAAEKIAGIRGAQALISLYKKGKSGMQDLTAATSENGVANRLAETALGGLEKQLNLLSGSLSTLAVELYESLAPVATAVVTFFLDMTNAVLGFVKENPGLTKIVVGLAAVAAAAGPVILALHMVKKAIKGTISMAKGLVGIGGGAAKAKAAACSAASTPCPAAPVAAGGKGAKAATGAAAAASMGGVGKAGSDIGKSAAKGIGGPLRFLFPLINPLLPLFGKIAAVVKSIGPFIARLGPILLRVAGPIGLIVTGVLLVGTAIKKVVDSMGGFEAVWQAIVSNPVVQELGAALQELGAAFQLIFDEISAVVGVAFQEIAAAWGQVYSALQDSGVIDAVAAAFSKVGEALKFVAPWIAKIVGFNFKVIFAPVVLVVKVLAVAIKALAAVVRFLWSAVKAGIGLIVSQFKRMQKQWNQAVAVVKKGISLLAAAFKSVKSFVAKVVARAVASFQVLRSAWNAAVGFIKGAIDNWIAAFQAAVGAVKTVVGKIKDTVTGFVDRMIQAGEDLVSGLIEGIGNMTQRAIDAITGVVGGVIDAAKSALKINSPSKVMADIGEGVVEGLALGISSNGPLDSILAGVFDPAAFGSWMTEQMRVHGAASGTTFAEAWAAAWKQASRDQEDADTERDRARENTDQQTDENRAQDDEDREVGRNKKRKKVERKIAAQQKILDDPKATKAEKKAARNKIKNLRQKQRQAEKDWAQADKDREKARADADRDRDRARQDADRDAARAREDAQAEADAALAVQKARESAASKIMGQRDTMRDNIKSKASLTASPRGSIRAMQKLSAAVTTTGQNLKTLRAAGFPASLLQRIAQMDPLAAARLTDKLVADKSLQQEFKDAYNGLDTAATGFANQEVAAGLAAEGLGADIVGGLLGGMQSGEAALLTYIESLGDAALDTLKDVLGIASPSREFAKLGDATAEGMAVGIRRSTPSVLAATQRMAGVPGAVTASGASAGQSVMDITVNPSAGMDEQALAVAVGKEVSWALGT